MEKFYDVSLVTYFGDVIMMTPMNNVITNFFKLDFVIFCLKNHNWPIYATLGHQNRRLRGAWSEEPPALGYFTNLNLSYKRF